MDKEFKSGFVAIVGSPNVGKSTLMNAMIGQKIAIVTSKPQTTRNRIMGVLSKEDYQIVFLDTPGIHNPRTKLGEYMVRAAYNAVEEVEAILFIVDAARGIGIRDTEILEKLKQNKAPVIVALNKMDKVAADRLNELKLEVSDTKGIKDCVAISALSCANLNELEDVLRSKLVPGPKYFPDDMVTDQPERLITAEIIREKAMLILKEEVPHGVGVDILAIKPREDSEVLEINAVILCDKKSHKGIIIGKNGEMLKKIGSQARVDIEKLFGQKVFLDLWVKIKPDWRNSTSVMKELGYE